MGWREAERGLEKLGNIVVGKIEGLNVAWECAAAEGTGCEDWTEGAEPGSSTGGTWRGIGTLGCCPVGAGARDGLGLGVDKIAGKRRIKPKTEMAYVSHTTPTMMRSIERPRRPRFKSPWFERGPPKY